MRKSRWRSWAPVCAVSVDVNNIELNLSVQSSGRVQSFPFRVQSSGARGGRPGLPVPNSPCGLRGRKATLN